MTRYSQPKKCLVCRRPEAETTIVDGHRVDACEKCLTDDFQRRELIRRAIEKENGG